MDGKITVISEGELDGEKTYKCGKCEEVKKESEGNFVLDGSAFCCEGCCPKNEGHETQDDGTCEFC